MTSFNKIHNLDVFFQLHFFLDPVIPHLSKVEGMCPALSFGDTAHVGDTRESMSGTCGWHWASLLGHVGAIVNLWLRHVGGIVARTCMWHRPQSHMYVPAAEPHVRVHTEQLGKVYICVLRALCQPPLGTIGYISYLTTLGGIAFNCYVTMCFYNYCLLSMLLLIALRVFCYKVWSNFIDMCIYNRYFCVTMCISKL